MQPIRSSRLRDGSKNGTVPIRSSRVVNNLPVVALAQTFRKLCLDFVSDESCIFKERGIEFWDQSAVVRPGSQAAGTRGASDVPRMLLWREDVCVTDAR